jgi:hypothetical protein
MRSKQKPMLHIDGIKAKCEVRSYSSNCRPKILANADAPLYTASAQTKQKTPLPTVILLLRHVALSRTTWRTPLPSYSIVVTKLLRSLPSNGRCLQSHYLATAVVWLLISRSLLSSGSTSHNTFQFYPYKLYIL